MKTFYHTIKNLRAVLCMAAGFIVATGCNDYKYSSDYSDYKNVTIAVEGLEDGKLSVLEGTQHLLAISVNSEHKIEIAPNGYSYVLSQPELATVNDEGLITPKKPGVCDLTVTFRGDRNITTTCKLEIVHVVVKVTDIKAPESVSVEVSTEGDEKPYNLYTDGEKKDNLTVIPGNADNTKLSFVSADPTIATVSEDGIVMGVAKGQTAITISSTDGTNIVKTVNVEVVEAILVSDIQLPKDLSGKKAPVGQRFDLTAKIVVVPANASNRKLKYTVKEGANVLAIDENGVLTTLAAGTATVEVAATDRSGITAEFTLTVDGGITDFLRVLWGVDTSVRYALASGVQNYVTDGQTGKPEHILDGATNTFLSMVKPGKTYNTVYTTPADNPFYFIIDMGTAQTFNYLTWSNRSGNSTKGLRARGVELYGSNSDKALEQLTLDDFTLIKGGLDNDNTQNSKPTVFDLPLSTYRYVLAKMLPTWDSSGSSIQTSEVNIGKK